MKEVILDTETTGLFVKDGHRIVEIGCVELEDLIPTKNRFHLLDYILNRILVHSLEVCSKITGIYYVDNWLVGLNLKSTY